MVEVVVVLDVEARQTIFENFASWRLSLSKFFLRKYPNKFEAGKMPDERIKQSKFFLATIVLINSSDDRTTS